MEELRKIREEPIQEKEIEHVKNFLMNSYMSRIDSPEKIIARLLYYEYEGLPLGLLPIYFQNSSKY